MKQKSLETLLRIFLIIVVSPRMCLGDHHYCLPDGKSQRLRLDDHTFKDEELIPEILDEAGHKRWETKACRWEIEFAETQRKNLQLVFMGVRADEARSRHGSLSNSTQITIFVTSGQRTIAVILGLSYVLPMDQRNHLFVEIKWDPRTQEKMRVRLLIPSPGICSWDMLSFHGNCHAFSPVPENVTVAMSNIGGDAQLASFISMTQINEFIAANTARLHEFPYQQPLNLSRAVRVGMFYRASDATILSVVRNGSGCVMRAVERPQEILHTPVTGACGSLRVDESGRAVIEFGDCSEPMLSLISFPEAASSESPVSDCSTDLSDLLSQEFESEPPKDDDDSVANPGTRDASVVEKPNQASQASGKAYIGIFLAVFIVGIAALLVVVVVFFRKSNRQSSSLSNIQYGSLRAGNNSFA